MSDAPPSGGPRLHIIANGEPCTVEAGTSLPAFLEARGLSPRRVVVERNGQALTPAQAQATLLAEGDRLEIVRIVAGG